MYHILKLTAKVILTLQIGSHAVLKVVFVTIQMQPLIHFSLTIKDHIECYILKSSLGLVEVANLAYLQFTLMFDLSPFFVIVHIRRFYVS